MRGAATPSTSLALMFGVFFVSATLLALAAGQCSSCGSYSFVVDFGSGYYSGGQTKSVNFPFTGAITGFSIQYDYVTIPGSSSWASDLAFWIQPGNNNNPTIQFGYTSILFAQEYGPAWSYQGSGSYPSGFYQNSKTFSTSGSGVWTFNVGNAYSPSGPVQYNNLQVTVFTNIPLDLCCDSECKSSIDPETCGDCSNDCTSQGFDGCCDGQCVIASTICGSCDSVCEASQVCNLPFGCSNCGSINIPSNINEGSPVWFVFNTNPNIQVVQYYTAFVRAVINGRTITNSTIFAGSQASLSLIFGGPGAASITYSLGSNGNTTCLDSGTTMVQVNDLIPQVTLNIPSKINTGQSFKANGTISEVGFWTRPTVVIAINGVISSATCTVTAQTTLTSNTQYSYACSSIHMGTPGTFQIKAIVNVSWGTQRLLPNSTQKSLKVGNTL